MSIQFENKTMTFGPPKNVRPSMNGYWLTPEHCEICAPQEMRWERNRCEAHAGCPHKHTVQSENPTSRVMNVRCLDCPKTWAIPMNEHRSQPIRSTPRHRP